MFFIFMTWCFHFGCSPDPEFLARLASVQEQKEQHRAELARWQQAVRSAAQLVRQSEAALSQLQVGARPGSQHSVLLRDRANTRDCSSGTFRLEMGLTWSWVQMARWGRHCIGALG